VFRSCEVNQRTEVRGLAQRCRGKGESGARTEVGPRTEMRMKMRAEMRMKVGWVPSIHLVEINK
jgi:hypothetical protein